MLMRQRIQFSNAIRGHMGEFGRVAPVGRNGLAQLLAIVADPNETTLPDEVRAAVAMLAVQLRLVNEQILELDRQVSASARATDVGRRLMEVPGVGPVLASALVATVPEPKPSSQVGTWRRGSGSCLDRTPAAARSDWEGSRSKAIATCDRCWSWARWLSFDTRNGMEPADHGSCSSSRVARPRSLPSRSPTKRRE